jgi:hypothetical protein
MFLPMSVVVPISAVVLTLPLVVAAAAQVPSFDVNPTCAGAQATAGGGGKGTDVCTRSELAARDQLAQQWAQFQPADRNRCVALTTMTRMPSYVQVLTCLEMARDARTLTEQRDTTGASR